MFDSNLMIRKQAPTIVSREQIRKIWKFGNTDYNFIMWILLPIVFGFSCLLFYNCLFELQCTIVVNSPAFCGRLSHFEEWKMYFCKGGPLQNFKKWQKTQNLTHFDLQELATMLYNKHSY